jgi:hypothetical protein
MAMTKLGKMMAVWAVMAMVLLVVSASAESKARIVRLSEVQGTVQIDRATGDGFDKAFINLPVVEGSKLKTGKDGRAEVEFEDGSALRLTSDSEVDFTRLALDDNGQKLTTVQLVSGTVYANLHPKKVGGKDKTGDQFLLNFSRESITVPEAVHFRVKLTNTQATVAVFKGKLSATTQSGQVDVAEKHSATIDLGNSAKKDTFTISKNYEEEPTDAWDRQQTDYHNRYVATGSSGLSSPYAYGVSDLNYYGSFMNCPGYGFGWQPYFMDASWSPFQDGGWMWYPGSGYMFVSAYPWGWMPYRYGSWAFAQGCGGWMWQPGSWNTWYTLPPVVKPPRRFPMPRPPLVGHTPIMVGRGLRVNPAPGPPHRLIINPGSAGYGVPRGTVQHLDHVAKTMGLTSRPVTVTTTRPVSAPHATTGFGARTNSTPTSTGRGMSTGRAPTSAPTRSAGPPAHR